MQLSFLAWSLETDISKQIAMFCLNVTESHRHSTYGCKLFTIHTITIWDIRCFLFEVIDGICDLQTNLQELFQQDLQATLDSQLPAALPHLCRRHE